MKIKRITWQDALPIRHEVLWPNKDIEFSKVEGDETATHYGAFLDDNLVCVASIYIDGNHARLRKFAALESYQGQGIGSQMLTHILNELKETNVTCFWCDARTTARGFYERFGMKAVGDEFLKSGRPYYKMVIELIE